MDADTTAALTQRDMIAVDQDPLAKQATLISDTANGAGRLQVYSKSWPAPAAGPWSSSTDARRRRSGLLQRDPGGGHPRELGRRGADKGWAGIRDVWGGDALAGKDLDRRAVGYTASAVPANQAVFLIVHDEDAP